MTEDLRDYLRGCISTASIADMCVSINEIGPFVSGLSISNPVSVSLLLYYTDVRVRRAAYHEFQIPKKSGGFRNILSPCGELKEIMHTLAFILKELYVATPPAMAYIAGKSIVDNACCHLGRNYVFNVDLSDFFPSITAMMVEHHLVKIGVSPLVATVIATLCTYPTIIDHHVVNIVPQGAPTSPVISNICATTLDHRLSGLAKRFHLSYTRYADDITFSSNHNVYHPDGDFMIELCRIIDECHFTINRNKTHLQKRGDRQMVTGLLVCEKPNVGRKFIKDLRAHIHKIKFEEEPTLHDINVVRGKLNFLRMVKGAEDTTYLSHIKKLNMAIKGKHFV
ncbi:MAG: RNA-directed DNA polymerase [Muribaculaceae bacterium]|nr:RNA-directed DNA polymerase [Muribaculaceae bacterium]